MILPSQLKNRLSLYLRWILPIGFILLIGYLIHERSWHHSLDQSITKGVAFYTPEEVARLRVDDDFLYESVMTKLGKPVDKTKSKRTQFTDDPLRRLFDPAWAIKDLVFYRRAKPLEKLDTLNNNSYLLNRPYEQALRDPWDDILSKSLYCDLSTYDDRDFSILHSLESGQGDYWDTHALIGLVLLRENHCFRESEIETAINRVAQNIISAQTSNPGPVGDLYAERLVVLYWAGKGNLVERHWINTLREHQGENGGWENNGHETGLALLALLFAQEGKRVQPFYLSHTQPLTR